MVWRRKDPWEVMKVTEEDIGDQASKGSSKSRGCKQMSNKYQAQALGPG